MTDKLPPLPTKLIESLPWAIQDHVEQWMTDYARKAVREAVPEQPRLTVRLTSFPESNGKTNWTAILVRAEKWDGLVGNCGGISLARGELWNRVAWEAECARFLIGERDTEPHILDYGDDIRTPEEWAGEVRAQERVERKAVIASQEAK